jgi:hypothetical protein
VKSISPTAVPAGAASLTLTITGSGFESDSTVQVGGVAVQATFISPVKFQRPFPPALSPPAASLPSWSRMVLSAVQEILRLSVF